MPRKLLMMKNQPKFSESISPDSLFFHLKYAENTPIMYHQIIKRLTFIFTRYFFLAEQNCSCMWL